MSPKFRDDVVPRPRDPWVGHRAPNRRPRGAHTEPLDLAPDKPTLTASRAGDAELLRLIHRRSAARREACAAGVRVRFAQSRLWSAVAVAESRGITRPAILEALRIR